MKEEIVQKSLQYFLQHGVREMSNSKLVELLGISTKTIYKHFKNKEELLEEVLNLCHAQHYSRLNNIPEGIGPTCLFFNLWHDAFTLEYGVNNAFYKDLSYYYPELAHKVETAITQKFTRGVVRILLKGKRDGSLRKDFVPEVILENIYVQYKMLTRSDRFKRFGLSSTEALLNTIAVTIRGICTENGVKELDEHITAHFPLVNTPKNESSLVAT